MTIVGAYMKYYSLKRWFDEKTSRFLNKIAEIDETISLLRESATNAVGVALKSIMDRINKYTSKIVRFINDLYTFIATFEEMIKNWITKKVQEITEKTKEKIANELKLQAETKIQAATAFIPPDEIEVPPTEYTYEDLTPPKIKISDVAKIKQSLTGNSAVASANFNSYDETHKKFFKRLFRSDTARSKNIDNSTDDPTLLSNMNLLIDKIIIPCQEKFKDLSISSGFRSKVLNNAIEGSATSQHCIGQAVDMTRGSKKKNKELFDFIVENLVWDQLIDEKDFQWVHCSYKNANNRREKLKYVDQKYIRI